MKRLSLSGFQLKYIALITMVFDHIQYFFEYTGKIPIWFTMIGRLAAPLFLFAVIEGFVHTHNRKKYFLRIDRKSTRLNSSHSQQSRMPSSA